VRGDSYVKVTECIECGREATLRHYLCHPCGVILGYASEEEP
jgi:ribosomal protein L32